MVSFITSIVLLLVGVGICFLVARRRPVGTPLTWGEAIVAAVFIFALHLLAYGILPNQFLLWADNELRWRSDAIAYIVRFWGRGQIIISKQTIRDVIVTGIYVILLGAQVALWAAWQKRGQRKPEVEVVESAFGRPLVKKV
jgi:hypothetical protein